MSIGRRFNHLITNPQLALSSHPGLSPLVLSWGRGVAVFTAVGAGAFRA